MDLIEPQGTPGIADVQAAKSKFMPPTHTDFGEPLPPRNKGGRPKGFNGSRSKMPSAMAQAFKKAGLDWKEDFALAIKAAGSSVAKERAWGKERIKLWLKLLPYMITTSAKAKVKKWKGKPSKAAMIALETLEGKNEGKNE